MAKELCLVCLINPYVYCKCGWKMCREHRDAGQELLYKLHPGCPASDLDLNISSMYQANFE